MKWLILVCFTLLFTLTHVCAQDLLDEDPLTEEELTDGTDGNGEKAPDLVKETIQSISKSQKIFLISNENQIFGSGDYISLLIDSKLVCRALVAKNTDSKLSGIKIIKVYSLELWKQLGAGKEVQILRGDDSYFSNKKIAEKNTKDKKPKEDNSKLKSDEDLYNSTTLAEDDSTMDENNNRQIKTDNLLSLNLGLLDGVTDTGATTRYTHMNGAWAYQISDNIWTEFSLGSNTIRDFPAVNADTQLIAYSARLKYTFSAPFYSYIQPYIGYQIVSVNSPGAISAAEFALVDKLKKSRLIAGASILRRIVPGWFVRLDLGSDLINGGLLLEF